MHFPGEACKGRLSGTWLINTPNGTLNLKTGKLQPHTPADLITKMVAVPYDPKAHCPEFERFFHKVTGGIQDKANFIRRALGYSLTGETGEQCLFVFHGPGANGKSTLTETVREILNDCAMHTTSNSLLHSKSSSIRNDIARLNGARFVSAVEVGMGKKLDEALIKQLTGGDKVTARFLYNEHFEYKPGFKLFISANHRPEIRGIDNGIWRRIHLIPFDVTIKSEEIDKDLPNKLKQELPGIFAWMVRGCHEWQSQGLNPPKCIMDATAEYRAEMDVLSGFIADKCTRQPSEKIPLSDLYIAFKGWSDDVCQETVGINNPKPVTMEELGSYVYDTDVQSVRQFLIQTGRISPSDVVNNGASTIAADRKDYYLARLLLDGLISSDNTYMTERQNRLYEAIKTINLGKLKLTLEVIEKEDEAKSLSRIAMSSHCWVSIDNLFELVNNGSDSIIAMSTMYKDLVALSENGILGKSRPPKVTQFKYFVMRLNMDKSLPLPEPSSIELSGSEQKAIELINPLTGQPEKI